MASIGHIKARDYMRDLGEVVGFSLVGRKQLEIMRAAERGDAFGRRTFIPTKHALSEAYTSNGTLKPQAAAFARQIGLIDYIPTDQTRVVRIVLTEKGRASLDSHRK